MTRTNSCTVCGAVIHPLSQLCKRCKKFVDRVDIRKKADRAARIRALQRAWDGKSFRCHYCGVQLNETDHGDPRYLTFDHRIPRREDDVVVAAACLNDMKTDMSEDEFRTMIIELASRFQGGIFDAKALYLKHWKRR